MKMNNPYQPVACSLHDEYEIAIMRKKHLGIQWLDDDGAVQTDRVLAIDILVKNKAEFLVAITQKNKQLCIRLDKITILDNHV